jgi:hypothetical protein
MRKPEGRERFIVCTVCEGRGTTVDPSIDANGLTREDFDEDPDFAEDYRSGAFDIECRACNGLRVVTKARVEELAQNAADRRLAAREDGDWESYSCAGDYRWG